MLDDLADDGFDYIVCDSPAGIEKGAFLAMYFADRAVVVVNPEVSSVRDSDRILGLLASARPAAPRSGERGQGAPAADALQPGARGDRRNAGDQRRRGNPRPRR